MVLVNVHPLMCRGPRVPNCPKSTALEQVIDQEKVDTLPLICRLSNTGHSCQWIGMILEITVKNDEHSQDH